MAVRQLMRRMMMMLLLVLVLVLQVQGQQDYVDNKQLDCYNQYNTTDGYVCNGVASSCLSYLTFRSAPPYNSPTAIGYLLSSEPTTIAAANNVSDVDTFPTHTPVIVPVNCSCAGNLSSGSGYYQHNASYVLKTTSDTYFGVANNTYQGLTTCQSLMAQNSYGDKNLTVGMTFQVPLRCACPTHNQTAAGFNFLLAYMVAWGDDPSSIAQRFGLDLPTLLQANRLSSDHTIYPFTPILVPLTTPPSPLQLQPPSPPPPSPSPPPDSPTSPNSSNNNKLKWTLVGVGLAASCLLLIALLVFFFVLPRRRRQRSSKLESAINSTAAGGKSLHVTPTSTSLPSDTKSSWSISSQGLRCAVESLTLYKLEDLQRATGFFSEANKIKGSCTVFRATFQGDDAAVKVMKGDVSSEINILKRINHSNIIRLSGFCVHQGNTYLVYEYAHCGSLSNCLHTQSHNLSPNPLSWKQRVQIAHDVADALNYLHNFTDPPCIHKDLNSSNILLDAKLRAKVSNFGLARALDNPEQEEEGGGFQLTRHVVGTQGYMAPEYIENGVITPKLDVFAFGVVVLELLSGREANDRKGGGSGEELLLCASISGVLEGDHVRDKLKEFMDPALNSEYPLDLAFSMAQLAKSCVAPQINSRPTMSQAFITLSKILSSTLDWDPSDADDLRHSSLSRGR